MEYFMMNEPRKKEKKKERKKERKKNLIYILIDFRYKHRGKD